VTVWSHNQEPSTHKKGVGNIRAAQIRGNNRGTTTKFQITDEWRDSSHNEERESERQLGGEILRILRSLHMGSGSNRKFARRGSKTPRAFGKNLNNFCVSRS